MKPFLFALTVAGMVADPVLSPDVSDNMLRFVVTQGGLLIALLAIGWSYRKDFTRLLDRKDDQIQTLTGLVASNSSALAKNAEASAAQVQVIQQLAQEMAKFSGLMAGRRGAQRD